MNIASIDKVFKYVLFSMFIVLIYSADSIAAGDPAKGKEAYSTTCVSCHGEGGKGDGVAAAALDPKPRDLSDAAYMSTLTDEHLHKVIKEGGAAVGRSALMPPWGGVLSDDKIWDVVSYLRSDICKCQHGGN